MEVPAPTTQDISALVADVTKGACLATELLAGQASTRRYYRSRTATAPGSVVVMVVPPEDRVIDPHHYPFLNMHAYLEGMRYPVPRVMRNALAQGMIVLEDLGDETLELAVRAGRRAWDSTKLYQAAIELIANLQAMPRDLACIAFGRRFDYKLLRWELDHFRQWLLKEGRGVDLPLAESEAVEAAFDRIASELAEAPPVLVHRDFQSRNIMVDGVGHLRIIDFQDALLGPETYDLVALLRDSYVDLGNSHVHELIDFFVSHGQRDRTQIRRLFHLQTVQRKLKDAGRFVFIDRQRGNPAFLPCIPLSLRYVANALAYLPEFADLHTILGRHVPELG
jgi:aminoglycoside/choline kinase family phosphotransferase